MKLTSNRKINISIIISFFSLVASFLTSFLFTRFLLNQPQIGDINYGLKTTVDSFISFVSIFTAGMSSTFIRFDKKYNEKQTSVFSTFSLLTILFSLLITIFGIILVILALNNKILDVSSGKYTNTQLRDFVIILTISILYTILALLFGVNKWFLESKKEIVLVRVVNLVVVILYPAISLPLVLAGANMVGVTLVYSLVYLSGFLFYFFYRIFRLKKYNFLSFKSIEKSMIFEILSFTFFVVVASSVETLNHSVDKIILTTQIGAEYATFYQLGMTLNQLLLSVTEMFCAPYIPYLTENIIEGNKSEVQEKYNKINFILLLVAFSILVFFVCVGEPFVKLWVGESRISVFYIGLALFSAWPVYSFSLFSKNLHRAANVHKKSSLLYVLSLVLHLAITLPLVNICGLWACVAGSVASMIFLGVSVLIFNRKKLGISNANTLHSFIKLLIVSGFSLAFCLCLKFLFKSFLKQLPLFTNLILCSFVVLIIWSFFLFIFYRKYIICFIKKNRWRKK